uniref:Thioredoxin domain-containing protein n=1 Tax=Alexandrium monilatum TaxID=311494 RepID=A0A7S4QBL8_9DINO
MAGLHFFVNGKQVEGPSGGLDNYDPQWASKMLGPTLVTRDGVKPTDEVLKGKKQVALLFAGSWCPWCKALEPELKAIYGKLKEKDPQDTEVVLLSSCADEQAFDAWYGQQPWSAVPFARSQGEGEHPIGYVRKAKRDAGKPQGTLGAKFGMASVPQLIVLDGQTSQVICEKPMAQRGEKSAEGYVWSDVAPSSWIDVAEPSSKL